MKNLRKKLASPIIVKELGIDISYVKVRIHGDNLVDEATIILSYENEEGVLYKEDIFTISGEDYTSLEQFEAQKKDRIPRSEALINFVVKNKGLVFEN